MKRMLEVEVWLNTGMGGLPPSRTSIIAIWEGEDGFFCCSRRREERRSREIRGRVATVSILMVDGGDGGGLVGWTDVVQYIRGGQSGFLRYIYGSR